MRLKEGAREEARVFIFVESSSSASTAELIVKMYVYRREPRFLHLLDFMRGGCAERASSPL